MFWQSSESFIKQRRATGRPEKSCFILNLWWFRQQLRRECLASLVAHLSLSFCEKTEKKQRGFSPPWPGWQLLSLLKMCTQSVPSALFSPVFVQKSGRRSSVKFKQLFPFPVAVFSGNQVPCPWFCNVEVGGSHRGVLQRCEWAGKEFVRLTGG